MIHVLAGKRNGAFDEALAEALADLGVRRDGTSSAAVERMTVGGGDAARLFDRILTPSLFGDRIVFVVSGLFDDESAKRDFLSLGEELARAPHDVVALLDGILAADARRVESFAKVQKIAEKKAAAQAFNPFSLASAFAAGDRKKTWILFQEAVARGDEMEPLHGMVWWKFKDMVQKNPGGAGDRNSSFLSDPRLRDTARALVASYHDSRLGGLGMGERLERFFLTMSAKK